MDVTETTTDSGIIKVDLGEVFRTKEWKEQIQKALDYQPKFETREEFHNRLNKPDPAPTPAPPEKPDPPDPPQPLSPPGSAYQSAPAQPLRGFSAGGYAQQLHFSNYASQYSITGGLLPAGGNFGAEGIVQGTQTIDSSGNPGGSLYGGLHGVYGPSGHMYNLAAFVLLGNTWGQNPPGTGNGNFGATAILGAERLFGPDRDHPRLTLGGNLTGSYLNYLAVSSTGQPPTAPSTNLSDGLTGGAVANATVSLFYAGKTPRLVLWGEGYGSYASGHSETDATGTRQPGGSILIGGGSVGAVGNLPFGANGSNILTLGVFGGGRAERDQIGPSVTNSTQGYWGAGAGYARRFW
jgi:hypothetical protein